MQEGRDHYWHELEERLLGRSRVVPVRADGQRGPALPHVHERHDREAEGHHPHDRPATSSAPSTTHHYIFDLKRDEDVYWCAADIGWITGHSYIVYGPLANRTTSVMYEGTPDFPDKDRWWDDRRAVQGDDPLHRADGDPLAHEVGARVRAAARPLVAAPARLRRRADQPRGVDLVPRAHRRRPDADRRHLVADRDGDDPDHAAAGDHDDQAGLGDQAVPGRRARPSTTSRATRSAPAGAATSC